MHDVQLDFNVNQCNIVFYNYSLSQLTCGIIDTFSLKSCNPISLIDTPSIFILPCGSARRNKADIRDDLPAPVRPTIPIFKRKKILVYLYRFGNSQNLAIEV